MIRGSRKDKDGMNDDINVGQTLRQENKKHWEKIKERMIGFFKTSKKYKNNDGINVRHIWRQENKKHWEKIKKEWMMGAMWDRGNCFPQARAEYGSDSPYYIFLSIFFGIKFKLWLNSSCDKFQIVFFTKGKLKLLATRNK